MRAVGLGGHTGVQADGAGAQDGHILAGLQAAPVDAVEGDGQRLSQGAHLIAHALGQLHQQVCGVAEILAHAAVHMDAQHLQAGAAVGAADGAGVAVTAVDVGIHGHPVAHLQALGILGRIVGDADDLTTELVADDPGIADQAVGAAEGADVAAADGGAVDLDQGLALLGSGHLLVDTGNLPGLCKLDGFHNEVPLSK